MFTFELFNILNDENINVGKRYKFSGEIKYGIKEGKLVELSEIIKQIKSEFLSDVIVIDFTDLKRWDSLGIRAVVPDLLEFNKTLSSKGRTLISIIGDKNADIYAAAKDKHPNISDENLPWYPTFEDFVSANG